MRSGKGQTGLCKGWSDSIEMWARGHLQLLRWEREATVPAATGRGDSGNETAWLERGGGPKEGGKGAEAGSWVVLWGR